MVNRFSVWKYYYERRMTGKMEYVTLSSCLLFYPLLFIN